MSLADTATDGREDGGGAGPTLVVVTGMSGAGKTTALHALDDIGFYCVDNLPPALAQGTVRICADAGIERVALGVDVRVGAFLDAAGDAVAALKRDHREVEVLYLDAADDTLVRRFSETRRPHPMLTRNGIDGQPEGRPFGVADGVKLERQRLTRLRHLATQVVDTTHLSVHDLRRRVLKVWGGEVNAASMRLIVMSFGFKHGLPLDASLVFDVRFLDNPHFEPTLKELTGNDLAVRDFVLASPGCDELLERIDSLLAFSIPRYQQEGKSYLTIAIGCTGGRHRSVALANELAQRLRRRGAEVGIAHRDVDRGAIMTEVLHAAAPVTARRGEP
jgi:UPF0042 nucleotide-binding protein